MFTEFLNTFLSRLIKIIMKTLVKASLLLPATFIAGSISAAPFLQLGEDAQLHLLGDVEFVYESNLFLRSTNEVADRYLVFSPGVELRLAQEGAASATLRYQHRFTFYRDRNELDGDFADLSLNAKYNTGVLMTSAYGNYREVASNTIDANRDGFLVERDITGIGGKLKYELSELTAMQVGVDYSETDYEDFFWTDHESVSLPVTFFYRVRPKVDLTAGIRYRTTDTSGGIFRTSDYEDMYYFVGAVGELFSPVIFADVSVGYQKRDFEDLRTDASSASYDITFIYTGDVKTTVFAGLSRDYRTSAANGNTYAFTSANLGARYHVSQNFGVNAGLAIGETEYEESPRAEDMSIINFGASYHPNDYLTLSANYKYTDVEGQSIGSSDYINSEIHVTASLRY